jgi:hypothetical protein
VLEYRPDWSDAAIRSLVRDLGRGYPRVLRFARLVAGALEGGPESVDDLSARVEALIESGHLEPSLPTGLGNVLAKRCRLTPGPGVGEVLNWLREEIIDGRLESDLDPDAYVIYLEEADPPVLAGARAHRGPSTGRGPSAS